MRRAAHAPPVANVSIRETMIVLVVPLVVGVVVTVVLANDGGPGTRWRLHLGSGVVAGPALAGGVVYAGTESGDLLAVDAGTGELAWRVRTGTAVRGGIVVGPRALYARADDGAIAAFAREDGRVLWRRAIGATSAPVWLDGVVANGTRRGTVVALDGDTGEELWRFETGSAIRGSVASAGRGVLAGNIAGRLVMLGARDGSLIAERRFSGHFDGPVLAFGDGAIIAGPSPAVTALRGFQEVWSVETGEPTRQAPVRLKDTVLVDASPDLLAFDLATGTRRWRYTTTALVVTFGAGERLVVVGTHAGEVHGLDARTGERRWRYRTNGSIRGAPIIDEATHTIYFGSLDGTLYAVGGGSAGTDN